MRFLWCVGLSLKVGGWGLFDNFLSKSQWFIVSENVFKNTPVHGVLLNMPNVLNARFAQVNNEIVQTLFIELLYIVI